MVISKWALREEKIKKAYDEMIEASNAWCDEARTNRSHQNQRDAIYLKWEESKRKFKSLMTGQN